MPRDPRLYMTFPIDIHRHPKLQRLAPDVRWTFVEMNGEARIADNDGTFEESDAEFMWPKEHLDALVASHPLRPLVLHENGTYVIRDYSEHQHTRAERERLAEVSRQNGRKGGRPRKNPGVTQAKPSQVSEEPEVNLAKPDRKQSQSQSQSQRTTTHLLESQSRSTRARVSTDAIEISPMTKRLAAQKGISSLRVVVDAIHRHLGLTVTADQAFQLSVWVLDKAPEWPDAPQRYVLGALEKSPAEISKYYHEAVA